MGAAIHLGDLPRPTTAAAPRVHLLHPGNVVCAPQGDRLETLLGSCVALILTDPRRTVAAMCHVVHARLPENGSRNGDAAFGEAALARMQQLLMARGITPRLCEASVIGGGNMFPGLVSGVHVGQRNLDWAFLALARCGMRVVFQDVGGNSYRRVGWTVGAGAPEVEAVPV